MCYLVSLIKQPPTVEVGELFHQSTACTALTEQVSRFAWHTIKHRTSAEVSRVTLNPFCGRSSEGINSLASLWHVPSERIAQFRFILNILCSLLHRLKCGSDQQQKWMINNIANHLNDSKAVTYRKQFCGTNAISAEQTSIHECDSPLGSSGKEYK